MTEQIQFNDGAAYERYMGVWSRLVGEEFLRWLAPKPGWRWLDVGCGNGAFTEMIAERCEPVSVHGIDPSEGQLSFARTRPKLKAAQFRQGDAMALPYPDNSFDAAVMPLVIFFVPVPAKGVAEMARVVSPGGAVTAYGWDLTGGGLPYEMLKMELKEMGIIMPEAPNPGAAEIKSLQDLWKGAGLKDIETRVITVQRTFTDFEEYWGILHKSPSAGQKLAAMSPENLETLKKRMRARLPADASGQITYSARAHAVKGRVQK